MLADKVTLEEESQGERVEILPVIFIFIFLFVTFLPLSGWISGSAGIEESWITSSSILLSSAVSILAVLATCFGGRLLPRLFCGNRAGR